MKILGGKKKEAENKAVNQKSTEAKQPEVKQPKEKHTHFQLQEQKLFHGAVRIK